MERLSLVEENIIKDIRNLFKLKKEQNCTAVQDIRNSFRQEKETKAIKDKILRHIKNLFEHRKEEENHYKPVRVSKFWSNNYIEYDYYTWKNIKKSYKNNKFKISAPTWNEEFELSDRSCSVSDIQDCFKYIFKKT